MVRLSDRGQVSCEKLTPTIVGRVDSITFHEHPLLGDEATLLAKKNGVWYHTDFWEVPTREELI